MLPKVALDGIATQFSCEQLIHCLMPGDKDAQLVVYGHGVAKPIQVSPVLLSAWGGQIVGFNISRWVHQMTANAKKMMAVMENITKLVRANKFLLDTVLYKVGEDAITDAFGRAADATDSSQVVLLFPTLQEESQAATEEVRQEKQRAALKRQEEEKKRKEDAERDKLKNEWLDLLFTSGSVAAMSPEGPVPIISEAGNKKDPDSIVLWVGDDPKADAATLKDLPNKIGQGLFLHLALSQHPAGEGFAEFSLFAPEVMDGSWYQRGVDSLENPDLDTLHDVELLGRSIVETIEPKLGEYGLNWNNVHILGHGKGAGVAVYASLLRLFMKPVASLVLFSPIVPFPHYLQQKYQNLPAAHGSSPVKMFLCWGNKNRHTPGSYRQLLQQIARKCPEVHCTPDTLPDRGHEFDSASYAIMSNLLPLAFKR
jgi:predicted esterase